MGSGTGLSTVLFIVSVDLIQANIIHQTGIQIKNTHKSRNKKIKKTHIQKIVINVTVHDTTYACKYLIINVQTLGL